MPLETEPPVNALSFHIAVVARIVLIPALQLEKTVFYVLTEILIKKDLQKKQHI